MRARSNSRRRQSSAAAEVDNLDENIGSSLLLANKFAPALHVFSLVSGVLPIVPVDELPDCEPIELNENSMSIGTITHTLSLGTIPTLGLGSGERIGASDSLAVMEKLTISTDGLSGEIFENDSQDFGATGVFLQDDAQDPGNIPVRICCVCQERIHDPGYFANGMYMHINCAVCKICGNDLILPKCVVYKDTLACATCMQSPKSVCPVCGMYLDGIKEIVEREERGDYVHAKCFRCFSCGKSCVENFRFVCGEYFCENCARESECRICEKCGEFVLVDGIKRNGKWYHDGHLCCFTCGSAIVGNFCVTHHNRVYCMKHGAIYNQTCSYCKGEIDQSIEEARRWKGKMYHDECFVCRVCGKKLKEKDVKSIHNRPHCIRCANMRINDGSANKRWRHKPSEAVSRRETYESQCNEEFEIPVYAQREDRMLYTATKLDNAKAPNAEDLTFQLSPV